MASSCELVIRNGTVVNGTGEARFEADVAIEKGVIVAVGPSLSVKGSREFDAAGCLVTPGWVDVYTHFDGQATWDSLLEPSTPQGTTTLIMGNCGVSFAPCAPDRHDFLVDLVEAIEDVPGSAIHEGLPWTWDTFEEYMETLAARHYACDVGAMIGHAALRAWVLGPNASMSDRPGGPAESPISEDKIAAMASVVRDAVAKGALGFSTSRAIYHRDMAGVLMPGSLASANEMKTLCRAIQQGGGGVFAANMDFVTFDDVPDLYTPNQAASRKTHWTSESYWLDEVAAQTAGDVAMTFEVSMGNAPGDDIHQKRMRKVDEMVARHDKLVLRTQCHVRPQGFLQAVHSRLNLLILSQTFRDLKVFSSAVASTPDGLINLMRRLRDPATRAMIVAEAQAGLDEIKAGGKSRYAGLVSTLSPELVFRWEPGCEPHPDASVASLARASGRTEMDIYYDMLVPPTSDGLIWDGKPLPPNGGAAHPPFGVAWKPNASYPDFDHEALRWMHEHPLCIPGVSDAGAHCGVFQDGTTPTHLLTHWARDRTRGPLLPVELLVKKQCMETARLFGFQDRGEIKVGLRADINVIDFDALTIHQPHIAHDLPTGASRWMQDVSGYQLTVCGGIITFEKGVHTGALPGRFVSNPKSDLAAYQGVSKLVAWKDDGIGGGLGTASLTDHALKSAQGCGASAIARIARDLEGRGKL